MAFQKILKPKADEFKKQTVTKTKGGKSLRSYALHLPKCPKPKKHCIYLPKELDINESNDVKQLWLVPADYQNDKPVKPRKGFHLRHHYSGFIEDRMHDWDIRKDDKGKPYLSYYGSGTSGLLWLILIIEEDPK